MNRFLFCEYKGHFTCVFIAQTLLSYKYEWKVWAPNLWLWREGQTELIQFGTMRKIPKKRGTKVAWKSRYIQIPYYRLFQQLYAEVRHGNKNAAHEAQRRGSYARRVMEAFGEELEAHKELASQGTVASAWRSKVLTPILQRQLQGVPDAYAPSLEAGIGMQDSDDEDDDGDGNKGKLTISDVTEFYLGSDPLHPDNKRFYVRNLVYIQEMRWHLAILLGKQKLESSEFFKQTLDNQDYLLDDPAEISPDPDAFFAKERAVLGTEGILGWSQFEGVILCGVSLTLAPILVIDSFAVQ
jgi:hypothetical protein